MPRPPKVMSSKDKDRSAILPPDMAANTKTAAQGVTSPCARRDATALTPTEVRVNRDAERTTVIDSAGTVIEGCERFLERMQVRGLSRHTIEAYAYDLALLHRWLNAQAIQVEALTESELYKFLAWSARGGHSPKASIAAFTR